MFWLKCSSVHLLYRSTDCSPQALQHTGQFTGDERGRHGLWNKGLSADPNPPPLSPHMAALHLDCRVKENCSLSTSFVQLVGLIFILLSIVTLHWHDISFLFLYKTVNSLFPVFCIFSVVNLGVTWPDLLPSAHGQRRSCTWPWWPVGIVWMRPSPWSNQPSCSASRGSRFTFLLRTLWPHSLKSG